MSGRRRRGWVVGVAAAALVLIVPGGVGGLVGLAGAEGTAPSNNTVTTSTRHVTTTQRVDRNDAPAPECDFPGAGPTLVDQTSTALEPVITIRGSIGPSTILIGDLDTGGTPFEVVAGTTNTDVLTTFESVVTQYFQATAVGEACAVLAAAVRFTG